MWYSHRGKSMRKSAFPRQLIRRHKWQSMPCWWVCCVLRRDGSTITTVDVMDEESEELLSGKVRETGVSEDGLHIDFGRAKTSERRDGRAPLIPFGSIYLRQSLLCKEGPSGRLYARSIDQKEEFVAEALIRYEEGEPSKRYPATLLMGDFAMCSFGLVRVTLPDGPFTTILRGHNILVPFDRSSAKLAKDGDFYHTLRWGFYDSIGAKSCSAKCPTRKRKQQVGAGKRRKTDDTEPSERGLSSLTIAVLTEIFHYLNTAQQCRISVVCSTWNDLLELPILSNQTTLEYGYMSAEEAAEEEFLNAASIFHRWGKLVTITNCPRSVHFKHKQPTANAGVFQRILQEKDYQPAQKVVLHNQQWNVCSGKFKESVISEFIFDLHSELTAFASVCETLVLRNLTVNLLSLNKSQQFQVVIVQGRICGGQPLSLNDWWDLIDDSFSAPTADVLNLIAIWIRETIEEENVSRYKRIMQILTKVQMPDPRDCNQYSNALFPAPTETNFDFLSRLDVKKLTRFTVHALLSEVRFRRFAPTIELSW